MVEEIENGLSYEEAGSQESDDSHKRNNDHESKALRDTELGRDDRINFEKRPGYNIAGHSDRRQDNQPFQKRPEEQDSDIPHDAKVKPVWTLKGEVRERRVKNGEW